PRRRLDAQTGHGIRLAQRQRGGVWPNPCRPSRCSAQGPAFNVERSGARSEAKEPLSPAPRLDAFGSTRSSPASWAATTSSSTPTAPPGGIISSAPRSWPSSTKTGTDITETVDKVELQTIGLGGYDKPTDIHREQD